MSWFFPYANLDLVLKEKQFIHHVEEIERAGCKSLDEDEEDCA